MRSCKRKTLKGIAISISIGLLWCAPASTQPTPLSIFEAKPELVELDSELYPLGWAKDGVRFAYLEILPWEVGDAPTITFKIVDLKTDKIVHEKTWEDLSEAGIDFDDRKAGIAAFWKLHGMFIEESLKSQQIARSGFRFHTFPGFYGERRRGVLSVVLRQKYGEHPIGVVGSTKRGVSGYSIELIQDGTAKTVYRTSQTKPEEQSVYPLAINVSGYLVNPAEDRIAILVAVTEVGWEGPPHTRALKIVGATIGGKF